MKPDKALQMLSLAQRAGKVSSGEFMTETSVKTGEAFLVIVAADASDNTKKKFMNMCEYYEVPIRIYSDKDTLGHCIGKEFRSSLSVNEEGLAREIMNKIV